MEQVSCNLCGSAHSTPWITARDLYMERLEVVSTFVRCRDCGLVYQNPRPSLDEIASHYPSHYELHQEKVAAPNVLLDQAVSYGMSKRCRYVTRYQPGGRLLDLGCATGSFLLAMQAMGGWQTHGVEISTAAALIARQQHGLDVFAGTLEQAAYPAAFFDAITMWDVFEHLHDPMATLQEIRRILKPGGVLVVRVPNLASWDAKLFAASWIGYDAPRHLYVFTPTTLGQMLAKAGLQVAENSCAVGTYMTFVMSVRLWMNGQQFAPARKEQITRWLYQPIVRLAGAPLFFIPTTLLRGASLVTVARKRVSID